MVQAEIHVANGEPVELPPLPEFDGPGASPADNPPIAGGAPGFDEPAQLFTPEAVAMGVTAGFDALAARRGEHWRIEDREAYNIAEPLAGELNELAEHAPFLSGAAGALGGRRAQLLVALGVTVGPRLATDVALARERREAEAVEDNRAQIRAVPGSQDVRQPADGMGAMFAGIPEEDRIKPAPSPA